ncbi:MAG: hypothetical protein JWO31_84 [Phycisphaerales bacterium]|nr:hypothetical protein [Phycisphaerales bacterium]
MPEWDVIGAERATGETSTRRVTADTSEAAVRAVGQSMLIEKVKPVRVVPPPSEPLHPPEFYYPPPSPPPGPGNPPAYDEIVHGANMLSFVGGMSILLGLITIVAAMAAGANGAVPGSVAAGFVFSGAALIAYGILSRFVGSLGLAVRDMARNSFGR